MCIKLNEKELLKKIRKEILFKEDESVEKKLIGIKSNVDELLANIEIMNRTGIIQDKIFVDDGRVVSKIKKLIKRCIRKSIYWFLRPYIDQQNNFNGATVRAILEIHKALEKIERKVD